ncbi:MAG: hypothetical protein Q7R73_03215 [bacterium]|nr:hypothetical protein [bacterium]
MDFRKGLLWAGIGALSISTLYVVGLFLFGMFDEFTLRVLLTTLTIGTYSFFSFATTGFKEKGWSHFEVVTNSGFIIAALGTLMTLNLIWSQNWEWNHGQAKTTLVLLIFSFALAHSSLLLKTLANHPAVQGVVIGTIFFITITAALLANLVLNARFDYSEGYFRFLITTTVLMVSGTIATPLVKKLFSAEPQEPQPETPHPSSFQNPL